MSRSRSADALARGAAVLALAAALAACGDDPAPPPAPEPPPPEPPKEMPYDTLSEYGFFEGDLAALEPRAGVVSYEVAASLWADHAGKQRFIVLPEGDARVVVGDVEEWQFPVGTIVIKHFFFPMDLREPAGPARPLETRLLILEDDGWSSHTYVWNDASTEAERVVAGRRIDLDYVDAAGQPAHAEYLVPNTNQCSSCHERDDVARVLGVVTPQMNRTIQAFGEPRNQLDWLAEQGVLQEPLPPPADLPAFADPFGDAPLDDRARAYLHANCSHCHRPGGGGGPSGLVLLAWEADPLKNGVCKTSAAAGAGTGGHSYDVVPGSPEESIMIFRMMSTDPEIKMPELPNRVPDDAGVALISAWIAAMTPAGCAAAP